MKIDNEIEISNEYLGSISEDFVIVSETLKEACYQLKKRNISEHPIVPICKEEMEIGSLIIPKNDKMTWNFNLSFLDEFIQRRLLEEQHVNEFKENYKNPDEYCCLFVVDKDLMGFVYIPYPAED